jgi:hypothetical protein
MTAHEPTLCAADRRLKATRQTVECESAGNGAAIRLEGLTHLTPKRKDGDTVILFSLLLRCLHRE